MTENQIGIQKTKNYQKFILVGGNRKIIPGHVAKLTTSIFKNNLLAQNPIIVNEKYEVIDGQHRLEVAKNNDLDIYYVIAPSARLDEIISLNSNSRNWTSMDYVNSYASQGLRDFLWLKEFVENYAVSISQVLILLYNTSGNIPRIAVRRGKISLTDEQKAVAEKRADVLWEIRPFMVRGGSVPNAFLLEMIQLVDAGYGEQLVKAIKGRGTTFIPSSERKESRTQLRKLMEA